MDQKTIHYHLWKMAALPNFLNDDLSRGFTVAQVAQKHGWTDPIQKVPDKPVISISNWSAVARRKITDEITTEHS